ncbi:hypothetical protein BX666DRAFT_1890268 [Dichotomocladium elegans]|nr:hypothetical protein BX666DRAFT_1890268 [Dichotomocladium elegans]
MGEPDENEGERLNVVIPSSTEATTPAKLSSSAPSPTTSLPPPSSSSSPLSNNSRTTAHRERHINQLHRRMSRISSTTLSDLIPLATVALKEQQKLEEREEKENNEDPSKQQQYQATPLARALTKVKVQIQSKRLKERYLGHEWIRLALDLPVDESFRTCRVKPRFIIKESSTLPLSPATLRLLEPNPSCTPARRVALKSLDGRTGEIAAWYEWKFNKSKWTVEDIEQKVDRLRKLKIEHHHYLNHHPVSV